MVGVNVSPAIVLNHIYCYFRLGNEGIFFSACLLCIVWQSLGTVCFPYSCYGSFTQC